MDLIQAIVLGIIQGTTEWLPISSTAHLRVVPALLGWQDPGSAFTAVIQLGTLAAVLLYFRTELKNALFGWIKGLRGGKAAQTRDAKMGWAIFLGSIPIVIAGVLGKKAITGELRSLLVIAIMLIVVGLLMLVAEHVGQQKLNVDDVEPKHGIWVGLWQAVALIPGASRSGSTMVGGLLAGFDRASAARFSFLLSVPCIFAAGVKEFMDERQQLVSENPTPLIVSTVVSFLVGYATIDFFLKFLQKHSTRSFVAYRIALGVLLLVLIQTGRLDPMAGVVLK